MRHATGLTLVLALLSLTSAAAMADDANGTPMGTPFDADGYKVLTRINPQDCLVGSDVGLKTMLAQISDLQKRNLIRSDVDSAHVKTHAWTTANAVAFKIHPMLITMVYQTHPEIDRCVFVQTITGLDGQQEPSYGFSMTREQFKKVDWKTTGPGDLPKDVLDFKVFKGVADHLMEENK